ncbi:hypothetical protein [Azospirillum agricola]|uniref:hypothetical protein n=1 Tax=Azospirillum agricola TaxID=1720247 RepID=UPI000A0F2342|nr:hypothetical protein [Azospirillum agricola]SMH54493.1 hypothetical protein SAMN02982994_3612 [Azospirillum lipoferum]
MSATDWIEERLESRREAARTRLMQRQRRAGAKKRAHVRDIARLMLVASLVMLAVLVVEMSRKAVTVLNHASAPAASSSIG